MGTHLRDLYKLRVKPGDDQRQYLGVDEPWLRFNEPRHIFVKQFYSCM